MRWFQNLKLFAKLLISFGIFIALLMFISIFNTVNLSKLDDDYTYLLNYPVEQKNILDRLSVDYSELRRSVTRIATLRTADEIQLRADSITKSLNSINNDIDVFQKSLQDDINYPNVELSGFMSSSTNIRNLINDSDSGYRNVMNNVVTSVENGRYDQASDFLDSGSIIANDIDAKIGAMVNGYSNIIDTISESLTNNADKTILITILLSAITVLLCAFLAFLLATSLSKRLGSVTVASQKLSEGIIDEEISSSETDEIGILVRSISGAQRTIREMINDLAIMHNQHNSGEIDYFADPVKYQGAYAELINNVNEMIESQIDMSKTALQCVGDIGGGNFAAQIQVYPGKKAFINTAIEELRSNIKKVSNEVNTLISASIDGKLSTRADTGKFQGDWRSLITNLNDLCDAIVNPVMEALRVLKEITKGNMKAKITGDYKGDFREMKESFNFTTNELSKYIDEIGRVLQEIADANLNITIEGDFLGDFSAIKTSIIAVNDRLNDMVSNISSITEQVSEGARSISESGLQLANGASEQAGSVQELSATVETVSQKAKTNSANADSANKMSEDSMQSAQESNKQMKHMLDAMEGIKDSSNKISNIIKTIEDIAFQTNLLALNAAVEAARAGEHGKGFSIVAEEVRSLAARSQTAAKETTVLIEDSINRVNDGTSIAQTTASSLGEIVKHVTEISGLISVISGSSKEQTEAVSQINIGLSQIANVATANAATSQESSAASEQLSSQAESLYNMISMFKLKDGERQLETHIA